MIAQFEKCLLTDPLRDVDWRWRLANELATSRRRLDVGPYDALTLRAARFRRSQSEAGPSSAPDETVEAVWKLSATDDDRRLAIEARLLAGSSVPEIARCSRESTDVVSTFAGLFFDVKSCLDHEDYIHCRVLRTPAQNWSTTERLPSCVHRLSYLGGLLVAEAVLAHIPAIKAAIEGKYDFASRPLSLEKRLAVLAIAMTAPLTIRETLQLIKKCPKIDLPQNEACGAAFARELSDRLDELLAGSGWETPVARPFEQAEALAEEDGEAA